MKDSLRKLNLSHCIPPRNTTTFRNFLKTYSEINPSASNYWLISENYCTTKANLMYQDLPRFHTETWHIFTSRKGHAHKKILKSETAYACILGCVHVFALFFPVNVELRDMLEYQSPPSPHPLIRMPIFINRTFGWGFLLHDQIMKQAMSRKGMKMNWRFGDI